MSSRVSSCACIDHSATYFTPPILLSLLQTKMAALHRFIAFDRNDLMGNFQTMNSVLNDSHIRWSDVLIPRIELNKHRVDADSGIFFRCPDLQLVLPLLYTLNQWMITSCAALSNIHVIIIFDCMCSFEQYPFHYYFWLYVFREEYIKLFDFVSGKNLRIKNTGKV